MTTLRTQDQLASFGFSEAIPIGELEIDDTYQRPPNPLRVNRIAENYDPSLFGVIEVSRRNGHNYVIDGQHRLAARRARGDTADTPVLCHVRTNLTRTQEAEIFWRIQQERAALNAQDAFRAKLTGHEPTASGVSRICMALNVPILLGQPARYSRSGAPYGLNAVATASRIYETAGPATLERTLGACTKAWPERQSAFMGPVIEGLALFLCAHHDEPVRDDRIVKTLGAIAPEDLVDEARNRRGIRQWTIPSVIALLLAEKYNLALRVDRLSVKGLTSYAQAFRTFRRVARLNHG